MAGQAQRAALLEEGSALSAGGEALRVELAAAREVLFLLLLSRSVDLRWYSGGQQLFGGASLSLSPVPAPWWGEDWAAREKERARGQEAPAAQTVSAGQGVAERERETERQRGACITHRCRGRGGGRPDVDCGRRRAPRRARGRSRGTLAVGGSTARVLLLWGISLPGRARGACPPMARGRSTKSS